MLVVTRTIEDSEIQINVGGDIIRIVLVQVKGKQARIGVDCRREYIVRRVDSSSGAVETKDTKQAKREKKKAQESAVRASQNKRFGNLAKMISEKK